MKILKIILLALVVIIVLSVIVWKFVLFLSDVNTRSGLYSECVINKFDGERNVLKSIEQDCETLRPDWIESISK